MNPISAIRRLTCILAGLAVAFAAAVPAAAVPPPRPGPGPQPALRYPPGWNKHPPLPDPARLHAALATGGMPGWQIALIAATAVLAAATVVVLLARARAARRRATASPA